MQKNKVRKKERERGREEGEKDKKNNLKKGEKIKGTQGKQTRKYRKTKILYHHREML